MQQSHLERPKPSGGNVDSATHFRPGGIERVAFSHALPLPVLSNALSTEQVGAPREVLGNGAKRILDIAVAVTALVIALPLIALVGLAIKATMGGPIMYSQQRVGWSGKMFRCYKFRTMAVDADALLQRYLDSNPEAAREWHETCKLLRDPRITPLGNVLRKASLDELPQLLNILRGEMSFVGPRPVVPGELERYGTHAEEYLKARPGLTGMWQISGRSKLSYGERVALDVYYANNWSLKLDLEIILKTIPAVLQFDQSA